MLIPVLLFTAMLAGGDPVAAGDSTGRAEPPATAPAGQSASRPARLSQGEIAQYLGQLGHPRFNMREEATQKLCTLDADQLPDLVQRYRAETRYELKRRIRYIIECIFHRDQIAGHDGFMGIGLYGRTLPDLTDPTTNGITRGLIINGVKPGFPAERAGLQDNDVIIALNGKPLPDDPSHTSFVKLVGSHPPGTDVALRVLRAAESRTVAAEVGNEPLKLLEGAKLDPLIQEIPLPQGLLISSVAPGSPAAALGLKPNEILRSLDNNRFGSNSTLPIDNYLRGIKPGSKVNFEVVNTKVVNVTVRLILRPPEYVDLKDKAEAQGRFLQWWQDQGGDLSLRPPDRLVYNNPQQGRIAPESSVIP